MLFGKPKIVVQDNQYNYFDDGKIEPAKRLFGNYLIIKVIEKEGYTCKSDKPPSSVKYNFNYKQDDKKQIYCYTNSLNTNFLKFVLNTLYGKGNYLLKLSDKLGILFSGSDTFVLYGKNWEEIKEKAQNLLQGLEYKEVNFEEIYKKIKPKKKNTIYIVVALLLLGVVGYYIYDEYFAYTPPPPPPKTQETLTISQQPQKKEEQPQPKPMLPYEESVYFLDTIMSSKFSNYLFISDVDFDDLAISLASFIPLPDFNRRGNLYIKVIPLKGKIDDYLQQLHINQQNYKLNTVIPNAQSCYEYLNKNSNVVKLTEHYIVYSVNKPMNINELVSFLNRLRNCPVKVSGNITFNDLLTRYVSLKIILYTPFKSLN